jgi:hypothetical protein
MYEVNNSLNYNNFIISRVNTSELLNHVLRKLGIMFVPKVSSQISLCSPHKLIRQGQCNVGSNNKHRTFDFKLLFKIREITTKVAEHAYV